MFVRASTKNCWEKEGNLPFLNVARFRESVSRIQSGQVKWLSGFHIPPVCLLIMCI